MTAYQLAPSGELRQKQPRVEEPAYLAYVRSLTCLVCRKPGPSDAAHLRSSALRYGKPHTGMGEKPDDKWTVPLCRKHHDEQHAHGNELAWWALQGIEPFAAAVRLYEGRPAMPPPSPAPKPLADRPTPPRKPPGKRAKVAQSRPLESRGFDKGRTRKFNGTVSERAR